MNALIETAISGRTGTTIGEPGRLGEDGELLVRN